MSVEVIIEEPRWDALDMDGLCEAAADAVLVHLGLDPAAFEIGILACDDARIAALNADFRDRPRPTNVLSWPGAERAAHEAGGVPRAPDPGPDAELGDIAIAWETCRAEAETVGKALRDHATHLIVHASLHLLGYDHIREADATVMESLEIEILGKLGIECPY